MNRIVTFRFDIDTELCLCEGVPRLLDLSRRLGVQFTYFVNAGRAARRLDAFRKAGSPEPASAAKLPIIRKLGLAELTYLLVANPRTLPRHGPLLNEMIADGHDVGLHGGRNHGAWAREARDWSSDRLKEEIRYGLRRFDAAGLPRPRLFGSPGWNSPPRLAEVLVELGFAVLADEHGPDAEDPPVREADGIVRVRTSVCGEPGGVGYLENMRARGVNDSQLIADFVSRLEAQGQFGCVYDHPFYTGRHELNRLEMLIREARGRGWVVAPLTQHPEIAGRLSNQ